CTTTSWRTGRSRRRQEAGTSIALEGRSARLLPSVATERRTLFPIHRIDHLPQTAEVSPVRLEDESREVRDLGLAAFLRQRAPLGKFPARQHVGELGVHPLDLFLRERMQ